MSNIVTIAQEFDNKYLSGAFHVFLFYLNVSDKFWVENDPRETLTLKQYLIDYSSFGRSPFIVQFNLGKGINLHGQNKEALFLDVAMNLLDIPEAQRQEFVQIFKANKKDLMFFLGLVSDMLRFSSEDLKNKNEDLYDKVYANQKDKDRSGLFSIYINYLENIVPPNTLEGSYSQGDRYSLDAVRGLAQSMKIRKSGNVVVLVTDSLTSIASTLVSETNGIASLKVKFPDQKMREIVYDRTRKKFKPSNKNTPLAQFGRLSSGMSTNIILSFVSELAYTGRSITPEEIFQKKKKFIEEQSNGLAEIVRPLWGISAIGSLEEHKAYALEVIKNMKDGKNLAVPMGIMFMGPPGTGKTVLAEAIAYEADIPLFKLKNLRTKWHGESERNQELVQELAIAQAPVIGFIDEFDQQFQARGTVFHGDSGTGSRMQGRFFEFISDTSLRGKILWIAATNMPGALDIAIREGRFDDWIPFFPPNAEERVGVFNALIIKNQIAAEANKEEFKIGKISEGEIRLFAKMCFCRLREGSLVKCSDEDIKSLKKDGKEPSDAIYLTGGQMENLIRLAHGIALSADEFLSFKHLRAAYEDYNPPITMLKYTESIRDAIQHTNRLRFMPKSGRWKKFADQIHGRSSDGTDFGEFDFTKESKE